MTSQRIYFWFLLDNFRDYINRIWSLILCWVTAGCVLYNLLYRPVNHGKWFFNTTQPDCSVQTGEGGLLYIPVYPNYVSKSSSVVRPLTYQRSLMSSTPNIVYSIKRGGERYHICWQYSTQLECFEKSHYSKIWFSKREGRETERKVFQRERGRRKLKKGGNKIVKSSRCSRHIRIL